jgi:hypothetical protein
MTGTTTFDLQSLVTLGTVDADGTVWKVNLDGVPGLGEPAPTLMPLQNPRQDGATAGDSFTGPRIMPITGTIRANTPELLNAAIDLLKAAVTNEDFLLTITESGRVGTMVVRRSGETITQKLTNRLAVYSIMVTAMDPRIFGITQVGSTNLQASSGGWTFPLTLPATIDAVSVSGQISLTNAGTKAGKVTARVDGPCHGPVITHRGSGLVLEFASSLVLGSGEWIDIDMDKHTVLEQGQASRSGYITSRGWSQFDVGENVWAFSAASFDADALLTINATPAR